MFRLTMKLNFDLYSRTSQLIVDGSLFAASLAAAYLIRFEGMPPNWATTNQLLLWLPCLVGARLVVNWTLGIYRLIWRYIALNDAIAIARSLGVVTVALLALRFLYPASFKFGPRLHIPLGIIALEYLMSLMASLAVRVLRRVLHERSGALPLEFVDGPKRALLYGAGQAGVLLVKNAQNRADVSIVGFIDDDPRKFGSALAGIKVLGNGDSLETVVRDNAVDQIVISIASPSKQFLGEVLAKCRALNVAVKIIPSLQDLFLRCTNISQFREVRIEDLLGRDGVDVTEHGAMIQQIYRRKRILVTGAGGSIGSELVRQLLLFEPQSIAVLDKDENSVFELEQELLSRFPTASVELYIADIRDCARLNGVFEEFKPEIVFHAAAHKHVPLMEKNPCEAILNNVAGVRSVLESSTRCGTERFVFISSDKAVNPTNVMGATKRIGELMVRSYAKDRGLPAACVRFGNVLGSRGSVIPLFQKQISQGGPVTVTHSEMVRFFMTIPEAVRLVLCAGSLGRQGETFVLDMGAPRKILDLAHEMVALAGFRPGKDIEIRITGTRPGEKLYEELSAATETLCKTRVEKLLMITPENDGHLSPENLNNLCRAGQANDRLGVYRSLLSLNIGFHRGDDLEVGEIDQGSLLPRRAPMDVASPPARMSSGLLPKLASAPEESGLI